MRQRVSGILDPDVLVGTAEDADDNIDGLLGAGGDDDLFRIASDRAGGAQVVADIAAKCDRALGIAITEMLGVERTKRASRQFAP